MDDIVLTTLDTAATALTFDASVSQWHDASESIDVDGSRRARMLIPAGVGAELVAEDGTRTPVGAGTLRATEYTVGDDGPTRMPGTMPGHIAYTYAVELSLDEAIAAGARVEFDAPVNFYVDNFLGFPAGTAVPVGSYENGRWNGEESGVVTDVLGVDGGGLALLDTDGDGTADDAATLSAAGITTDERTQLASRYATGDSFWRVAVTHLTPFDCNWPYGFDEDADQPTLVSQSEDLTCPGQQTGTIIGCDNRSVAEEFPVAGTNHVLRYQSNRVRGHARSRRIRFQYADDFGSEPATWQRTSVAVTVAGRWFSDSDLTLENVGSNRFATLDWDGFDFAGRLVDGTTTAHIQVCNHYDLVYQGSQQLNWGQRGGSASVAVSRSSRSAAICTNRTLRVGGLDAQARAGLGGLTLSTQHHFDPRARVLHLGSGETRLLPTANGVVSGGAPTQYDAGLVTENGEIIVANSAGVYRIENDNTLTVLAGGGGAAWTDGAVATSVFLNGGMQGLALGPDSSIYIGQESRILRLAPDGRLYHVAGDNSGAGGSDNFLSSDSESGEHADARSTATHIGDVAVGDDGTVYYTDRVFGRIRRITDEGRIETLAGGGGPSAPWYYYEEVTRTHDVATSTYELEPSRLPGREVVLINPSTGLVVRPGGRVIFRYRSSLIAISSDGNLTPLTGARDFEETYPTGSSPAVPPQGLPIPAGDASLFGPNVGQSDGADLFVANDGSLLFSHSATGISSRVWRLDGKRLELVGVIPFNVPLIPRERANGTFALAGSDFLTGASIFGDPSEYSFGTTFQTTSADGTLRYVFEDHRHVQTLDNQTGQLVEQFNYDVDGRLDSFVDAYGNTTDVQYGAGQILLVAPFGETTVIDLDASDRAESVSYVGDPNVGAETTLVYDTDPTRDGLITEVIDRRGQTHEIELDALGQLNRDSLVEMGSSWDLAQTELIDSEGGLTGTPAGATRTTTVMSAQGRTTTYSSTLRHDGSDERVVENPDGTRRVTTMQYSANRSRRVLSSTTEYPDGSTSQLSYDADPHEGWNVPFVTASTFTLPSGGSVQTEQSRTIERDVTNHHILTRDTRQVTRVTPSGDRTTESDYQRQPDGSGIVTITSPEGRRQRVYLDIVGRVVRSEVLLADDSPAFAPVERNYDSLGRLSEVRRQSGATVRSARLLYTSADVPFSATERGYPLASVDGEGDLVRFEWDAIGQAISSEVLGDEAGPLAAAGTGGERTELGYDVAGLVNRVRPPDRNDHLMTYSGFDALQVYSPPALSGTSTDTTWTPTTDRDETDRVDMPDARSIDYTYDATSGRLSTLTLSVGVVSLDYAPLAGETVGDTGQLRSVSMPQLSGGNIGTELAYDGPLLTEMRTVGLPGGTHAVSFAYDANDELRLSSITVDSETPTTYTYDNDGLLLSAGPLTLTRNAQTGLAETSNVGVVETTYTLNAFGETANIDTEWGSDALNFEFQYDLNGRIQSRTESSLTGTTEEHAYVHDDAGRLTDVFIDGSPTPTYHYEYDANGNRVSWQTPTSSCSTDCVEIDEQDRLLRYGTTTFTYSERGQLRTKIEGTDVTQYTYDELGNLRQVDLPDGRVISYLVDGMNRRVGRLVDGVATNYWVYHDALNPVAQFDGTGNVQQVYIYGTKPHVPDLIIESGRTLSVLSDQVGSVRRVVDTSTGDLVQWVDYSPFGVEASGGEPGFVQPFRFAGGLHDPATGLVRFGARDYSSETGRWTTKDPILLRGGGTNLYQYSNSRPHQGYDPTGLWTVQAGVSVEGCAFLLCAGASAGPVFGTNGDDWSFEPLNISFSGAISSQPASAEFTLFGEYTSADSVDLLQGFEEFYGIGAGEVEVGQFDVVNGLQDFLRRKGDCEKPSLSTERTYSGARVNGGVGAAIIPFDIHRGVSGAVNPFREIYRRVSDWWSSL